VIWRMASLNDKPRTWVKKTMVLGAGLHRSSGGKDQGGRKVAG